MLLPKVPVFEILPFVCTDFDFVCPEERTRVVQMGWWLLEGSSENHRRLGQS